MRTIYKYPLEITDHQTLDLPDGAKVLHVAMQRDVPCIWAMVETDAPMKPVSFRWCGTGHGLGEGAYRYVGTVHLQDGAFVFHLFEIVTGESYLT